MTAPDSTPASCAASACSAWKSACAGSVDACASTRSPAAAPPSPPNCPSPSSDLITDMSIRILLADDHTVMRDGLRAMLERQPDMAVIGEAADGRECVRLAGEHPPDVVVMDIAMPNMNGIEATRRILAESPRIAVVILSMHQDESYILRSLKAGAKGYLLKDALRADVLEAIRAVAQGRSFLTRKIGRMLQED